MIMKMLLVAVLTRSRLTAEQALEPYREDNENYFTFVPTTAINYTDVWNLYKRGGFYESSVQLYAQSCGLEIDKRFRVGTMRNINAKWDWRKQECKHYDLQKTKRKSLKVPDVLITIDGTWVDNPTETVWMAQLNRRDVMNVTYFLCHSSKLELNKEGGNQYDDFDFADIIAHCG